MMERDRYGYLKPISMAKQPTLGETHGAPMGTLDWTIMSAAARRRGFCEPLPPSALEQQANQEAIKSLGRFSLGYGLFLVAAFAVHALSSKTNLIADVSALF